MAFSTVDIRNSYKAAERPRAPQQTSIPGLATLPRCPGRSSGPAASPGPGPRPAQPPCPALGLVWPSRLAGPGPRPALDLARGPAPAALPGPGLARPGASCGTSPCIARALTSGTAALVGPELPVRVDPPNPQTPFSPGCEAKGSFKTEVTDRNSSNFRGRFRS